MRLLWMILSTGFAVACNGGDNEASSGEQELGSNTGSGGNATESTVDSDSENDVSGERTNDPEPGNDEVESTQNEAGDWVPEAGVPNAMTDGGIDPSDAYVPGDAARVPCEGMDEQTCREQKPNDYMRDDEGALWMFPTTCIPEGWQQVAADDPSVSVFEDVAKCD